VRLGYDTQNRFYASLKSPTCSCVSITLPAPIVNANHNSTRAWQESRANLSKTQGLQKARW